MPKTKAETIVYPVHNGLYVNLTNRCSCACTFCIRQTADGVGSDGEGGENNLWLDHEPTFEEVAAEVKRRYHLPVRVNTNGQGSLINERDIAPEFAGIVDTVSISLNTPNAQEYAAIVRSQFGNEAFQGMLDFAREVRNYVPHVVMTTVDTTISHEDEAACQRICDELGVRYRIRAWVNS